MEESPSLKVFSCSAGQDIPYLLWSLSVYYSVHKIQQLDSILSLLNPVHTLTSY
jgi:hypothetical protein